MPVDVHFQQVTIFIKRASELAHLLSVLDRVLPDHAVLRNRVHIIPTRINVQVVESLLLGDETRANKAGKLTGQVIRRMRRTRACCCRRGSRQWWWCIFQTCTSYHQRFVRPAADYMQLVLELVEAEPDRCNGS